MLTIRCCAVQCEDVVLYFFSEIQPKCCPIRHRKKSRCHETISYVVRRVAEYASYLDTGLIRNICSSMELPCRIEVFTKYLMFQKLTIIIYYVNCFRMFYLKVATDVALIASTGRLFHRTDPLYI
jgi:hypothetical protein